MKAQAPSLSHLRSCHVALCLQDAPQRIPLTSCRAGAVVHLLAANGTKLPVTLKMNTKEDPASGHFTHIVQVCGAPICCLLMLQDVSHTGFLTQPGTIAGDCLFEKGTLASAVLGA